MLFCKMTNFIHLDMKNSLAADLAVSFIEI